MSSCHCKSGFHLDYCCFVFLAIILEAGKRKDDRDQSKKAGLCMLTSPAGSELCMSTEPGTGEETEEPGLNNVVHRGKAGGQKKRKSQD